MEEELHKHKIMQEMGAPNLSGKIIEKATWINADEKIRLYFTDGSFLSIGCYIERLQENGLRNFLKFAITPAYGENDSEFSEANSFISSSFLVRAVISHRSIDGNCEL
ncbi:MAG: hypothetical protein ACI9R3_004063 [Verrucomicrobiales bacterium]|jgi:hypothetical protein